MTHQIDDWQNCYDLGWGDLLVPEAYSHPAKMSRSLVFRIIDHALKEGWIQPGQTVLDCFGGVGTTALPALLAGLNYVGVELEPRFVELGRQNLELWQAKFSDMPKWKGSAVLLQGDSRRLAEIISAAGCVVSSPPYAETNQDYKNGYKWAKPQGGMAQENYGSTPGQLATLPPGSIEAVIASPSFAGNTGGRGEASRNGIDAALFDRHSGGMKKGTGDDPANLDHLPMGTLVVGSPPYAESLKPETEEQTARKQARIAKSKTLYDGRNLEVPSAGKAALGGGYGITPGQLGAMKAGELAVVGSPPYADNLATDTRKILNDTWQGLDVNGNKRGGAILNLDYGSTPNQLGNATGETFWSAARLIVEQCALLLPPGAVAIWVVKQYVKGGKIVDFPGQWRQLCEACGFETVHEHRAMLVKNQGLRQSAIGGGDVNKETKRASFFRLLAEKKGAPKIDWETVLCMVRR